MPFAATWMNLGYQTKFSKKEKDKYLMTSPICGIFKK